MASRDRGVTPGLLDRHFGISGTDNSLTPQQAKKNRAEKRRLRAAHARAFEAVIAKRPAKPPPPSARLPLALREALALVDDHPLARAIVVFATQAAGRDALNQARAVCQRVEVVQRITCLTPDAFEQRARGTRAFAFVDGGVLQLPAFREALERHRARVGQ